MKLSDCLREVGRPVAYYPKISKFVGSVKAAIFLCQFIYWEGKQMDKETRWIFKTQREIQEETGLSRYEQEGARRELKKRGHLEEIYKGIPRKVNYRINWDKFNSDWDKWIKKE